MHPTTAATATTATSEVAGRNEPKAITLRLEPDLAEMIEKASEIQHQTVSDFIRSSLRQRMEELEDDEEFQKRLEESQERTRRLFRRGD